MDSHCTPMVYAVLPNEVLKNSKKLGIQSLVNIRENYIDVFLKKHITRLTSEDLGQLKYSNEIFKAPLSTPSTGRTFGRRKFLTAKEKRALKLFEIKPEEQKYELYVPMHKMWKEYMKEIINFRSLTRSGLPLAQLKVLKADYHGSIMTVSQSRCPSLVGTTGIVLQETKNTVKLITKENKLKCVPKANSIFVFHLEGYCFTVLGNHIQIKASERAHKKFKIRPSVDL